jgi:hypothetical protein
LEKGETWYGRPGTPYEGVAATVETITARNVQVSFDRIVQVDGLKLSGKVMPKGTFKRMFEPIEQLEIDLFG